MYGAVYHEGIQDTIYHCMMHLYSVTELKNEWDLRNLFQAFAMQQV